MSPKGPEGPKHPKREANPQATRPKHANTDFDRLVKAAWTAGWWIERSSTNYLKCYPPGDGHVVIVPSTPHTKGHRLKAMRQAFRAQGLDV